MKLSKKDKSLLLLVAAALIILWGIFSVFSNLFFVTAFRFSDATKITSAANRDWFNVSGPLEVSDLKDRVILLHFWTYACVSCIENLSEIRKLESEFGNKLLIIGVHSAKSENEKNYSALKKAVLKYGITYPVVNDHELKIWNSFGIRARPTFVLIDPHGKEVARYENQIEKVVHDTKKLLAKYKYQINREPLPMLAESYNAIGNVLNFPTKLEYAQNFSYKSRQLPAIFISNSGQNNIIIASLSGDIIVKIGSGKQGFVDGSFDVAAFSSPRGLLFDGAKLYVADTGNNALRVVDFKEEKVETVIGASGQKGEVVDGGEIAEAKKFDLASPSDLKFFPDKNTIAIANSGTNQILSYKIKNRTISVLAGNGLQGIEDGKYPSNSLAQTSDMSVFGHKLYFVDALSSSLREVDENGNVKTLIGSEGKSGHENGGASKALMQHPLGILADDTGIYVSDSFNHRIRKYDFSSGQIRDLIGTEVGDETGVKTRFDEPEGIISVLNHFYVADSNNNRIVSVERGSLKSEIFDVMPPLKLQKENLLQYLPNLQKSEEIKIKSDSQLLLKINLSDGWKINERGPSFVNLLEMVKDDRATLIASFDWNVIRSKEIKIPKLTRGKKYLLQGVIYYCEDKKGTLCYVKSYEQRIYADSSGDNTGIVLNLAVSK